METRTAIQTAPPAAGKPATRAIAIAVLAMGGEGGGVLADWIVDLAERNGYCAQTTSVPGVAQRTGATIYYIELFPQSLAQAAGKAPVLALMPIPGEVDIVIASELMEAGRAIQRGLVTPERTTLIASTHRVYSMTEKTALADGQVNPEKLLEACGMAARQFVRSDFASLAADAHSVISAVLFGALAGAGALPFARESFEEAIRSGGVGVPSSLAAFDAGFEAASAPGATGGSVAAPAAPKVGARLQALAARVNASFPSEAREILLAGVERLGDYQDERYAAAYLDWLEPARAADERYGSGHWTLLREAARYLALWMSYEDAIRVADLKTRRSRFARVRQETRLANSQVLHISEFLYPRLEEVTDVMPARLGTWVRRTRWASRIVSRLTEHGRVVRTTSLRGYLQLYFIAGLRRWRRGSLRFAEEHRHIGDWLQRVTALASENYALACEVAEAPRVRKGYGDTYARGRGNFDALMSVIPALQKRGDAPEKMKQLREAALADEHGEKLAQALAQINAQAAP
jgi:indolepyruvate ferredoxin oxidoreductase beta subunit